MGGTGRIAKPLYDLTIGTASRRSARPERDFGMDEIDAWLTRHGASYETVVGTLVLLVVATVVILAVSRLLRAWLRGLEARLHITYSIILTITRCVTLVLWLIVLLMVLDVWGVGLGGVWSLLVSGAAVVGVGFLATWAMVSNFTASFFIAVWRPFHLGDTVELLPENLKGRVVDRNLLFTVLRENGGSVIQVPNNLFLQKIFRVGNGQRSLFEILERQSEPQHGP